MSVSAERRLWLAVSFASLAAGLCKPKDKVLARKPATSPETAQGVPSHPPPGAKGAQCSRSGEFAGRPLTFTDGLTISVQICVEFVVAGK